MRGLFAAAALGLLLLAGCHSSGGGPAIPTDPASIVFTLRGTYDASFLAPAAHYRGLGLCAPGQVATLTAPCANVDVIVQLQKADNVAHAALDAAEDAVRNHPSTDASSLIADAQGFVNAAIVIVETYGVH